MQKRAIAVVLSMVAAMIVASIALVLTVGPRVHADAVGVLNRVEYFNINAEGVLTGFSSAGNAYRSQFTHYHVAIPDDAGVTVIGSDVFNYKQTMLSVKLPAGLLEIWSGAFDHCVSLTTLEIPDTVTTIQVASFNCCTGLTTIKIPESVTIMGNGQFTACTNLQTIYCEAPGRPGGWGERWVSIEPAERNRINVVWGYGPKVTVNFNTMGGNLLGDQAVKPGNTAVKPVNPTKDGYTFGGWYTDENCTDGNEYGFDTPVETDITLYAKWNAIEYTITFISNGGTDVPAQTKTWHETVGQPVNPTNGDYLFGGWYSDESLQNAYNFSKPVESNLTLYAKWTEQECVVTFETNGGSAVENKVVNNGAVITAPVSTRYGYHLVGWCTDTELKHVFDFTTPINEDKTLYAQWELNKYTVTFNSNGGNLVSSKSVVHGYAVSEPDVPTKDGCDFGGWFINEGLTMDYDFANAVYEDLTLYAKWTDKVYMVTFEVDGVAYDKKSVTHGNMVTAPAVAPQKTGYIFQYWYVADNNVEFDFATEMIKGNLTLYAAWEPKKYTVTLRDSDDESLIETVNDVIYNTLVMPDEPVKAGYNFIGWYRDKAGTMVFNLDTPITADLTLYAKWSDKQYIVVFSANGGSLVDMQTVDFDGKALRPEQPVKSGYDFVNWYTKDGNLYDFDSPVTANVTLYAKWEKVEAVENPTNPDTPIDPENPEKDNENQGGTNNDGENNRHSSQLVLGILVGGLVAGISAISAAVAIVITLRRRQNNNEK